MTPNYQDEQIHNSRLINISNARNVALLIGEAQLTENTPGAWDGTPEPLYHQLANLHRATLLDD